MTKTSYKNMSTDELRAQLIEEKHKMNVANTLQMTLKIALNSNYGAGANKHYPLFNEALASATTMNTRYFVRLMSKNLSNKILEFTKKINDSFEPYVYSDTDSAYVSVAPLVEKYCEGKSINEKVEWVDAFTNKILNKVIDETIIEFTDTTNAYEPAQISVSREAIADSGIFMAKKKYILRVRDNEGTRYPEDSPYIKTTGVELQQGGTSPFAKKYLKEAIPVMLDQDKDGVQEWYKKVREEFTKWPIDDIAKTQGVSKIHNPNWGKIINGRKVSVPFGSRVCVTTNNYIKNNNLTDQFPLITAGEKVKVLFLTQPNKMKSDAFGFNDSRLAEKFKDQIDYDITFDKYFVSALNGMLEAVGVDLSNHTEELDEW